MKLIRYRGPADRLRVGDRYALRDGEPIEVDAATYDVLRTDPSMTIEVVSPPKRETTAKPKRKRKKED